MRLFVSILLFLSSIAAYGDEKHQHQGGCDKFPWDMNREFSLMVTDPVSFDAATSADPEWRRLPMDRRVQFKLRPTADVTLAAKSEKQHAASTFSGMAPVRVPYSTRFRISSTKPVWIDVVGPSGMLTPTKIAVMPDCEKLVKAAIFKMDIEQEYWIQITGSPDPVVELMFTMNR
jgi:hypothetical protein